MALRLSLRPRSILKWSVAVQYALGCNTGPMGGELIEEQFATIDEQLGSMDGTLEDQVRVRSGLSRIIAYFRAADIQQRRIGDWLYEPLHPSVPPRYPLDEGMALCEAHFYFTCWDSIHKVLQNLQNTVYGFGAPSRALATHGQIFRDYRDARNHLEHLPERYPGRPRTDWRGDMNSISGTVAGIRRDGFFTFQGRQWDVTERSAAQLRRIVEAFIADVQRETRDRFDAFPDRSAMWAVPDA